MPPHWTGRFVDESGCEDDGQVGVTVGSDPDFPLGDGDIRRHVDEVTEDLTRLASSYPRMRRAIRR